MEVIGNYSGTLLTADPSSATIFAIIGWTIVFILMAYSLSRCMRKPAEVAKRP